MADMLSDLFNQDPSQFISALPKEERRLMSMMLSMPQEDFISVPRDDDNFLMM